MQLPGPFDVRPLFREERAELLSLLGSLTADHWSAPTACPGWTVKDVALHLLAQGAPAAPAARVTLDQLDAWRLYTKGAPPAALRAVLEGERRLAEQVLRAVAIIA